MGTISEKLTYLDGTREKIKNSINITGANITNQDTFRSYANKLKQGLVDIINNGVDELYNNFPKVTGMGINIELNNTYEAPMKVELNGNTEQQNYTGKNLFKPIPKSGGDYGFTATYNNKTGRISLSGTGTESWSNLLIDYDVSIPVGTYTFSITKSLSPLHCRMRLLYSDNTFQDLTIQNSDTDLFKTITTTKVISGLRFWLANTSGTTININDIGIQFEQGSFATEFEPYVGGISSPNPNYPQDIQVVTGRQEINIVGKNLLKNTLLTQETTFNGITATPNNDGTITLNGTSTADTYINLAHIDFGSTSFNSYNGGSNEYVASLGLTGATPRLVYDYRNKYTFIYIYGGITVNNLIVYPMIEKGTVATDYEKYQSFSYDINLGKNLFDKDNTNIINAYFNDYGVTMNADTRSFYIPCKPNTTYTVQKNDSVRFRLGTTATIPSAGVPIIDINQNDSAETLTLTTSSNARYLMCYFYATFDTNVKTLDEVLNTIQIEVGTEATSYSSYFTPIELCKIGNYQDKIKKSTGKNLFDKSAITSGYLIQINGSEVVNASYGASDYIPVKANTQYTKIWCNNYYGAFYDNNKNFVGAIQNANTITPSVDGYVRISFLLTNVDSVQLEQGSTQTSYEPYGKVWYVEKQIGKVVLDGSEGWYLSGKAPYTTLTNAYCLSNQNADVGSGNIDYVMSDHFSINGLVEIYTYGTTGITLFYMANNPSEIRLAFGMGDITVADFKTWLSTHSTEVYYVLKTSAVTEITNTELINQLETIKSVENQTNINVIGDLPVILNVSALKKEE